MSVTGITVPEGFVAAATTAGIKASGKPDMGLVFNQGPEYTAAGVFTRNKIKASPVKVTKKALSNHQLKALIYNSGNANACNGSQGDADASAVISAAAQSLGIDPMNIGMCSTGIIGEPLPVELLTGAIPGLVEGLGDHGDAVAEAIMTTDTCDKQTLIQRDGWCLGGMAKGVGMMAPSLATMLVCLTTDASVDPELAKKVLGRACNETFNRLDIDGSTSTNDTVLLLCNGASGKTPEETELYAAVLAACEDLAHQLQADGEGVTKRIRITVTGTTTDSQALEAARTIGRDSLFKCAMFGSDPNWGRVLAAVGMADADMDPDHIRVSFNGHTVCLDSCGTPDAREADLTDEDVTVKVDLGTGGPGTATVFTTDLSHAYVEINSAYTT